MLLKFHVHSEEDMKKLPLYLLVLPVQGDHEWKTHSLWVIFKTVTLAKVCIYCPQSVLQTQKQ